MYNLLMRSTWSLPVESSEDRFARRLAQDGQQLSRVELKTLQLNLGKLCNLACHHCHVESGPNRTEVMSWSVVGRILDWIDRYRDDLAISIVDLTGGAPEMSPCFRKVVKAFRKRGFHVLDRCNLTILLEPGFEDMVDFLAQYAVEVVASLPCYLEENVDAQRGQGVFGGSIEALRRLNQAGYGMAGSGRRLDLVFNPVGYGLPPRQDSLEHDYKYELKKRYGIVFNRLWTITNMPIKRFAHELHRDGMYNSYMTKLDDAHRAENVNAVMCRSLVSIGWQGSVYDCDFNQMLQMPVSPTQFGTGDDEHMVERNSRKLWEYTPQELLGRAIRTGSHCLGCTAGTGSSCTGSLA